MSDEKITIDFDELVGESDLAVRIRVDKDVFWLPKSEIMLFPKTKKVSVPEWLALKKGLI